MRVCVNILRIPYGATARKFDVEFCTIFVVFTRVHNMPAHYATEKGLSVDNLYTRESSATRCHVTLAENIMQEPFNM